MQQKRCMSGGNGVDDGADSYGYKLLCDDNLDVFFLITDCICGSGSGQFSEHIIVCQNFFHYRGKKSC